MNYRTILYLTVTAACLVLLLWLLEQRDLEDQASQTSQTSLFPTLDTSGINRIGITRDEWRIELERYDRGWRITQPFIERADADRVHRLLAYIERLPIREIVTPDEWLARGLHPRDFGLATPLMALTLAAGDREFVLWVGRDSPLDNGVYIRIPDKPDIMLTDRELINRMPRTADDIREQIFFEGVAVDIVRVDIKPYAGQYIQLMRADHARWRMQQPAIARTEPGVVRQRLDHLLDARIQTFLPVSGSALLASYGLDADEAVLTVTLWKSGDETGSVLYFGNVVDDDRELVFARRGDSDSVYTVARHVRDAFLVSPDALRDKRILQLDPWTVDAFKLRQGNETIILQSRDSGWYVMQPVQWRADDENAMNILILMAELRARRFIPPADVDLASMGLDAPRYGLTLWVSANGDTPAGSDRQPAGHISIGRRTDDGTGYYARRDGDDSVFTLAASDLDGRLINTNHSGVSFVDPLMHRDRSVLSIDPDTVWRIELQRGQSRQVIDRDGDTWVAVEPAGHRVNHGQAQLVLDSVRELRALRVESRTVEQPAAFGFDQPGMILTFHLTGADGLARTLITGFRARTDGLFTMVQGRDLVFAIARDLIERMSRDLTIP